MLLRAPSGFTATTKPCSRTPAGAGTSRNTWLEKPVVRASGATLGVALLVPRPTSKNSIQLSVSTKPAQLIHTSMVTSEATAA